MVASRSTQVMMAGQSVRRRLVASVVVAAGGLAYLTSFSGVFVFDDVPAIVENHSIRSLSLPEVLRPPASATVSGRPVANVTFALNYMVGAGPFGFHLVNLSVHLAAALLLVGVVRRSLDQVTTLGTSAAAAGLAAVIGLLWVTHPLHVSSVTYIVQRVESLMGLLFLATLYSAIRAWEPARARDHRRWVLLSAVCCALGMATKEPMVMAPVLVWLWDVVFQKSSWLPWRNTERRAIYAMLAATWVIPVALLSSDSQARLVVTTALQKGIVGDVTPLMYLWTQMEVVLYYARLTLVPVGLAFDYYDWPLAHGPGEVIGALVLVLLLLGGVGTALWRRHPAGYAGAWCFLILAPTSSLVPIPTEVAAEHRMYLPSAGLISIVVVLFWRLMGEPARLRILLLAVVGVASLATAVLTFQRNKLFWTEEALWAAAVRERPGNPRARINYGIALMKSGREVAAEEQMRAALVLPADKETRTQILVQLGSSLAAQGQSDEGTRYLEQALALDPDLPEAHSILGQTYEERGERLRALQHFERSLERRPDNVLTLNSFVWIVATAPGVPAAKVPAAVAAGERALRLTDGRNVDTYQALAAAYARNGQIQAAITTAETGMQLAQLIGHPSTALLARQRAHYESLRGKQLRVP